MAAGFLLAGASTNAQNSSEGPGVLTDALVFHGSELAEKENLDIYVSVPYQSLEFREFDDRYAGQFITTVVLRDLLGRRLLDTNVTRSILTEDYAETRGATGRSENLVLRFPLKAGSIRYEITVKDAFSRRSFEVSDTVAIPDLTVTPALSSIMYVSEIEERNGRFKITPYIGNMMWQGERSLFAFYELYLNELPKTVLFRWQLSASDGRRLGEGASQPTTITTRKSQHFVPLRPLERALPGSYQLRVMAHPIVDGEADTTVILASRERRYIVPRSLMGSVLSNLTLATKQLAYVADQEQIDLILNATDPAERQFRFEEFWKRLDPSPQTVRNEAFEEYYARIATANKRFQSYAEGWLTDMGRIYVVFGEPLNIEQFRNQTGQIAVVRWTYGNNRTFTFEDSTGFGDYRLRGSIPPNEKYQYRR